MREALARSDHDFVLTAPARPRRAAKKSDSALASFGAALLRKPGRTFAAVVFGGLLSGVVANALFFQTARHPAPIFHGPVVARPAQHAAPPMPIPVPIPPQRPSERIVAPQAQPQAQAQPQPQPSIGLNAPARDQIGALLSGGAPSQASGDVARVAAAQKALVKLGYVVKSDGVMGAGTRKAIEMFEQSRKLPVTGELTPRVARELSALSGIAVP